MQDGRCKQHRIAVIHSPSQRRGKRVYLPQKRYVFGRNGEAVEDFWDRVWEEICKNWLFRAKRNTVPSFEAKRSAS